MAPLLVNNEDPDLTTYNICGILSLSSLFAKYSFGFFKLKWINQSISVEEPPNANWQTVQTQITRRRILRLIWVYTVCIKTVVSMMHGINTN